MVKVLLASVIVAADYILALVCHEAGHVLVGLCCGGELLLWRVGRFGWMGKSGLFVLRTARGFQPGQSILHLKHRKACIAAAAGGGICNLLAAGAAGMVIGVIFNLSERGSFDVLIFGLLVFAALSLCMAVFSLLPLPFDALNDGNLILALLRQEEKWKRMEIEQQRVLMLLEAGNYKEVLW